MCTQACAQTIEESEMIVAQMVRRRIMGEILPCLEKFKYSPMSDSQKACIAVIEDNLKEIHDLFTCFLSVGGNNLTQKEIRIADLVICGKTSKEIADVLKTSKRAVEFHRNVLRKKLGLLHQKTNLRDFFKKTELSSPANGWMRD
jgi:DNA-binding NarL/FixJ family response regulator